MEKETTSKDKGAKPSPQAPKKPWLWLVVGLVVGILGFIVYRAAVAKDTDVHYHANFALYINGQQDKFEGPGFYEEVAACNVHNADDLASRAHMHANINHV